MAYSNDGAYLAVIDETKVAIVFTVADGYSVNIRITWCPVPQTVSFESLVVSFQNNFLNFFFFPSTRSKMSFMDTMPNQCPWPGHLIMSTLQLVGWTWWCLSGPLMMQKRGLSSQVGHTRLHVSRLNRSHQISVLIDTWSSHWILDRCHQPTYWSRSLVQHYELVANEVDAGLNIHTFVASEKPH